jgi:dTMP kinase
MCLLVACEGIDGSGKGTQSQLLLSRLQQAGYRAALLQFPQYANTFFGARIADFLNGRFGELWQTHPFLVSLLFAGDRLESRDRLHMLMQQHDVVVLDRYVASNEAHQSARCPREERGEVQAWIEHLEFNLNQLPRPTLQLLFDISAPRAQALIARKRPRDYTSQSADLQEADTQYLAQVREVYLELAQQQTGWSVIPLEVDGSLRSIEEIAEQVWRTVEPVLSASRPG